MYSMINPILLDEDGNSIFRLTQWDKNQKLILDIDVDVGDTLNTEITSPYVHYCNIKSTEAINVLSTIDFENKKLIADIPNELLQEPYNIIAYIYMADNDNTNSQKTVVAIKIPVKPRVKPSDYQYVNNSPTIDIVQLATKNENGIKVILAAMLNGLHYAGECTYDTLPSDPMLGDYWYCTDKEMSYAWNGKEWYSLENTVTRHEVQGILDSITETKNTVDNLNTQISDKINEVNEAISNAQTATQDTIKATSDATEATNNAISASNSASENASYAKEQGDLANEATQNAQTATDEANKLIEEAKKILNGDLGSKTVTFTDAEVNEPIVSGEKLNILFGKLSTNIKELTTTSSLVKDKYASSLEVSGKTLTLKSKSGKILSTITTQDTTYPNVTASQNGIMLATDKAKLDSIANNANNYIHPASHPASIITQDATHRFASDNEKNIWNAKLGVADIVQNAVTNVGNKPVSASVAKSLQDQVNTQSSRIGGVQIVGVQAVNFNSGTEAIGHDKISPLMQRTFSPMPGAQAYIPIPVQNGWCTTCGLSIEGNTVNAYFLNTATNAHQVNFLVWVIGIKYV